MSLDLFQGFDPAEVAAIEAAHTEQRAATGRAVAQKSRQRKKFRRAKSEATLAEILPATFAPGDSWHVMSHGDIDALSYLAHAIKGVTHFDYVALSTWCIAKPDLEQIESWLDAGRIEHFELYAGEIFPNQYGDEYEYMLKIAARYGCRFVVAKNHSKVTLARCVEQSVWLAIESSANVNTNPRIEQTAIHASRELFDFYKEFFDVLRSIDRSKKSH